MLASFTFLVLSSNWSTCDILKRERDGSVILAGEQKVEILYYTVLGIMNHKGTEHQHGFIVYWCLYHMETNFSENTYIWKTCLEFVLLLCTFGNESLCLSLHLKVLSWWEVKEFSPEVFLQLNSESILPTSFKEHCHLARVGRVAGQNSRQQTSPIWSFCFQQLKGSRVRNVLRKFLFKWY